MASNDTGFLTLTTSEAIGKNIRVKLSSGEAAIAGAGEEAIGTTVNSAASGAVVTVKLDNAPGTHEVTSAGAITQNAAVYNAASGKVDDVASGSRIGVAIGSASAVNAKVEVLMRGLNS